MGLPLGTTFEVLGSSKDPQATGVLIAALDVDDDAVRSLAVTHLLRRRNPSGHVELIRRLEGLTPALRAALCRESAHLTQALRQCLTHGDDTLKSNALEVIRLTEDYDQLASLLEDLAAEHNAPHAALIEQTISELIEQLYERLHPDGDVRRPYAGPAEATWIRDKVLHELSDAFTAAGRSRALAIEGILVLGELDHPAVKLVMKSDVAECRDVFGHLLLTSDHPGVMQLSCDAVLTRYPHPKAVEALTTREDLPFVTHFLRSLPDKLKRSQRESLRQIESIQWLRPGSPVLGRIPPHLQPALVALIGDLGLPLEEKEALREWFLRHGSLEGRTAARESMKSLDNETIRSIILDSLDSNEPDIQVWATEQLREQGIPEAFSLLIQQLESPVAAVQDAARTALDDFNLSRMLGLNPYLPPEVCVRAGDLLRKIHPESLNELRREMAHPVQWRRVRALKAARAMGLHVEITSAIVAMLQDPHSVVRQAAVEVLADVPTHESLAALLAALRDAQRSVRDAAAKAVDHLKNHISWPHRIEPSLPAANTGVT